MFTTFSTALSALRAESTAIDVVGNNLANLNTTGFKASEVQFHDLISQTIGTLSQSNQVGMGVGQIDAIRQYSQGAIQNTQGATDVAIEGNGFFVVKGSDNQSLYTRNGSFHLDSSGNLITTTGEKVQGWSAVGGAINSNGPVGNITVPLGAVLPAIPTANMTASINLNALTPKDTGADPNGPDAAAQFSAPVQIFDSLGNAHTLTMTFTKTDVNSWDMKLSIPAADVKDSADNKPVDIPLSGTTSLSFGTDGTLPSANTDPPGTPLDPVTFTLPDLADGAKASDIKWSLYDTNGDPTITQFAQASGVSGTKQDGAAAGQITKIGIQDGGMVVGTYSNGLQTTIGQLALASISNPETLIAVGNNNLQVSAQTAEVAVGTSGSSGRGKIVGGALESSNADIATEFTNLLTFQRSYQAASRVITTSDQLMQETVNLIHP